MFLHWSLLGHRCPLKLHFIANLTIALHNSLQNYLSTLVLGIVDVIATQEKSPNKAVDDFLRCDFLKIDSEWETGDLPDLCLAWRTDAQNHLILKNRMCCMIILVSIDQ